MAVNSFRILFLADTHLGFDYPFRPRIQRRRRGPDFFNNYHSALQPARRGEVDCVVHGGDLFYRSRIPAGLVRMAFAPLIEIADRGIPVLVVPGNHERSNIPYRMLAAHRDIHIFDRPRTFLMKKGILTIALAGFPYFKKGIRQAFMNILAETGWQDLRSHASLLCMHHCVEGATVGPSNYTFRYNPDVIRGEDIPQGIQAVLTGHIHRFQVLDQALNQKPSHCPVFYPGSTERTSFAEKDEEKGYLTIELHFDDQMNYHDLKWAFHPLPTRPMVKLDLAVKSQSVDEIKKKLLEELAAIPADSIVQLTLVDRPGREVLTLLSAKNLRHLAPPTMNISLSGSNFVKKKRS